jgi:SAM-dependent methyltransferase
MGEKIERLLGLDPARAYDLLEVGTGSGGIAHYFAAEANAHYDVVSVDVEDTRLVTDGYAFRQVDSTTLPFPDASFDVVLTNHVIEHVGDAASQAAHLREIRRVLRPDGIVYLAVPNRWMLVEPHYKLAFLSWLPHRWRSPYLRMAGKGDFYDCEPLQMHEVEALAYAAGLVSSNRSVEAFRVIQAIEGASSLSARLVAALPDWVLNMLRAIIPTHIYVLQVPREPR